MPFVGETKIRFTRSYVYLNPNTSASIPEDQRPGTWRLSEQDDGDQPDPPGPAPEGSLGFQVECKEPGGVVDGQLVICDQFGARLAKADNISTGVVAGAVVEGGAFDEIITVTRNETIDFLDVGTLVDGGGTFLTVGANYFLSSVNPGNWTTTPDVSTAGAVVAQVGTAVANNQMSIEIQQPLVI